MCIILNVDISILFCHTVKLLVSFHLEGDEIFEDADEEEGDEEREYHLGAGDAPIIINSESLTKLIWHF